MKQKRFILDALIIAVFIQLSAVFIIPILGISNFWINFGLSFGLGIITLEVFKYIIKNLTQKTITLDLSNISGLYTLTKKDIKQAAISLGSAFEDDPLMTNLVGQGKGKKRRITAATETFIRYYFQDQTVYATSKDLEGVIIITQGNQQPFAFLKIFTNGAVFSLFGVGLRGILSLVLLAPLDSLKAAYNNQNPFIYIQMVGVSKDHQGKGFGKKLLNSVIQKSQELKVPIYLETETESNVRFYEKFGFKFLNKVQIPVIEQTMWTMDYRAEQTR
jgi:ribosomal protein S18 acetylase RimI-like enzyme